MSGDALVFMILSWTLVLTLTGWCFHRVLRAGRRQRAGGEADPSAPGAADGGAAP